MQDRIVSAELKNGANASDEKLTVADLKAYCKANKLTQSGDKPTLFGRCKLQWLSDEHGLVTSEGVRPFDLRGGALKKAAARCGVSPVGSNDEILPGLVEHLVSPVGSNDEILRGLVEHLALKKTPQKSNKRKNPPRLCGKN